MPVYICDTCKHCSSRTIDQRFIECPRCDGYMVQDGMQHPLEKLQRDEALRLNGLQEWTIKRMGDDDE